MPAQPSPQAIRLRTTFPSTKVGFGPYTMDILKQATGYSLAELLAPVVESGPVPIERGGARCEEYTLRLEPGDSISIPLGNFGEVGMGNDDGIFALIVPNWVSEGVARRLEEVILSGPERGKGTHGGWVDAYRLQLPAGFQAEVPLGQFGSLGLGVLAY